MSEEKINQTKYCVTALIDLRGFSSHLEISIDLRTRIGEEAIKRLQILEEALKFLKVEQEKAKEYYPDNLHVQRINDAIILTMDLHEMLIPEIGESIKTGLTFHEIRKYKIAEEPEQEKAEHVFNFAVKPLMKFVGIVSRIHSYINYYEKKAFFPGAKSVISTGYRESFSINTTEDYFSANFSFTNAYMAEKLLHGTGLHIDNYVIQLLSYHYSAFPILKRAMLIIQTQEYDPFRDGQQKGLFTKIKATLRRGQKVELEILRRKYSYLEMNSSVLNFFQISADLYEVFKKGEYKIGYTSIEELYEDLFTEVEENEEITLSRGSVDYFRNTIEDDILELLSGLTENADD